MRFHFADFVLDTGRAELRRGAGRIELEPRALRLLTLLLERRGDAVGKEELLDALWPDTATSESSLTRLVSLVRAALDDRDRAHPIIRTLYGRGYQVAVPIEVAGADAERGPERRAAIAVLPFDDLGRGARELADGIVEDLTTALARRHHLPVIARNSAFAYRGRSVDVREVGRELGAGWVVEGSVRRSGERVRLTVQLIETASGHHVWADKYDCTLHDVLGSPDELVARIADALDRELRRALAASTSDVASSFVGREELLCELEVGLREALDGRPRTMLVCGEPGIGKTRTLEELARRAGRVGAETIWGRSLEQEGTPPLWPWVQVFRRLSEERTPEALRLAAGADASLLGVFDPALGDGRPASVELDPALGERARFRFLDAVARVLERAARERPLLLMLDDLQYADATSLALLGHVAREARDCDLMLVGAYRNVAAPPNPALERLVAELSRLSAGRPAIPLAGLSERDVGAMLECLDAEASPEQVREVHAWTDGNPLFVRELARLSAAERGAAVPDSIGALVEAHARAVAPATRSVLDAASVLGRVVDPDVVARALGSEPDDTTAALEDAFAAGLVEPQPEGTGFRFVHALVCESLYALLSPTSRAGLHDRVADALEARHAADPDAAIGLIAHHRMQGISAGDPERALDACLRAADAAMKSFAHAEAGDYLEASVRALERCESAGVERRFELLLRLADVRRVAGQRDACRDVGLDAMALARRISPRAMAQAAIRVYDVGRWFTGAPEAAALEEALAAVEDHVVPESPQLLSMSAHSLAYTRLEEARALARVAVDSARRSEDASVLVEALYVLHCTLAGPDHLDERESIAREVVRLSVKLSRIEFVVIQLLDVASDRLSLGDIEAAREWRARAGREGGRRPLPGMIWHFQVWDAGLAILEGRLDDGLRLAEEARDLGARTDHPMAKSCFVAHQALSALARGEGETNPKPPRFGADTSEPTLLAQSLYARRLLAAGRRAEAAQVFASFGRRGFSKIPRDVRWCITLATLGHVCAELGDADAADPLLSLLDPVGDLHGAGAVPIVYVGSMAGAQARLLAMLGRADEAASRFDAAIAAERGLGARPSEARTRLDYADLLTSRGDAAAARSQAGEALRIARELGLGGLETRARAACGLSRSPPLGSGTSSSAMAYSGRKGGV